MLCQRTRVSLLNPAANRANKRPMAAVTGDRSQLALQNQHQTNAEAKKRKSRAKPKDLWNDLHPSTPSTQPPTMQTARLESPAALPGATHMDSLSMWVQWAQLPSKPPVAMPRPAPGTGEDNAIVMGDSAEESSAIEVGEPTIQNAPAPRPSPPALAVPTPTAPAQAIPMDTPIDPTAAAPSPATLPPTPFTPLGPAPPTTILLPAAGVALHALPMGCVANTLEYAGTVRDVIVPLAQSRLPRVRMSQSRGQGKSPVYQIRLTPEKMQIASLYAQRMGYTGALKTG